MSPSTKSALLVNALWVPFFIASAQAQMCPPTETVFYNGHILTGKDLLTPHPEYVQALAVEHGGKITYIGTNEQAKTCNTDITTKVDLHGAFVMPGFNDAHTHMAAAGNQKQTVDLDNIPTLAAMQAAIKTYADKLPDKTSWITGGGWDHTKWLTAALPTRQDLDAVTGNHPTYLERTDGHIAVVNTAALAAAGITGHTPDPQGGQIDHDATGQPTGIIRDTALALIGPHIPQPDVTARREALTLAINDALAHGVTSVQDFSDREDFEVLQTMEHEGKLHLRFAEWMPFDLPVATLKQYQASQPITDPWLHTSMLKGFMDGSLGSRTAALLKSYSDDPKNSGLPRYDQAKLNAHAVQRSGGSLFGGFQLGFHAIGDRANSMALDAFEAVNESVARHEEAITANCMKHATPAQLAMADACTGPPRPSQSQAKRFRIEHAQVLTPTDFDRFKKLGIIASMQPSHLLTDMTWAEARLGHDRSNYAYAWRSMLDHHITLAFGTDYPVESINPFRGLYAAITRQNIEGTHTFHLEQKITLNEAIYAYTQASAFAEFTETTKGILAKGYWADFIVLDRDITKSTPQEILQTKVFRTVIGGQTQYQAVP